MTDAFVHPRMRNNVLLTEYCSRSYKWVDSDHWQMTKRSSSKLSSRTKATRPLKFADQPETIAKDRIEGQAPRRNLKKSDATTAENLPIIWPRNATWLQCPKGAIIAKLRITWSKTAQLYLTKKNAKTWSRILRLEPAPAAMEQKPNLSQARNNERRAIITSCWKTGR